MYKINRVKFQQKNTSIKDVSAKNVVNVLFEIFKPKSVVDVGCGTGLLLKYFQSKGVSINGYEGEWIDRELISNNITDDSLISIIDFENLNDIPENKSFEMCICLEVAEHVSLSQSEKFVNFISQHSELIVFSAAIPNQGGFNHINEQWGEFWDIKFKNLGYIKYDILRPILWGNDLITWPHKQNMVVYVHSSNDVLNRKLNTMIQNKLINPIHYESYLNKTDKYLAIINYKQNIFFYFKLFIKRIFKFLR